MLEVPYRVGAVAAWLSAVVGLGGVAAALALAPWFSWTTDALSDLGHPRHASALAFNAGLIASGVLYLVFLASMAHALPPKKLERAGELCLALGALSLSGIGVINESFGAPHFVVSFTYFMFLALGMALLAFALWSSMRKFAVLTLALSGAGAFFGISIIAAIVYGFPFPSQAIPEMIASSIFAGWSLYAGLMLTKRGFRAAWGQANESVSIT